MDDMAQAQAGGNDQDPHQHQSVADSATEKPPVSQRVSVLQRSTPRKYVQGMRNMGWIAGLVHAAGDDLVVVQQTNNMETAIPVRLRSRKWTPERLHGRLLTMEVHVHGLQDQHGPQCMAELIGVEQPSIMDLPASKVWASGFGKNPQVQDALKALARNKSVDLFDEKGQLKPEYRQFVREVRDETGADQYRITAEAQRYIDGLRMFGDMAEASGYVVDSRMGSGRNYVSIAGFLDAKSFINATEYRKGFGLLLIRQHADQSANIPVRITDARISQMFKNGQLQEGTPLLINGSLRRKVYPNPDDPSQIAAVHTYIECVNVQDVKPARLMTDILDTPPWWTEIRDRLAARKAERDARREQARVADLGERIEPKPVRVIDGL